VKYKIEFLQEMVTRTVKQWPDMFIQLARPRYADEGPLPDDLMLWSAVAATTNTIESEVIAEFSRWFMVKQRAEVTVMQQGWTPEVDMWKLNLLFTLSEMCCVKPVVDSGLFCRQAIARLEQGRARALTADFYAMCQDKEPRLWRVSICLNLVTNAVFMTNNTNKKIFFCGVMPASSFFIVEGNLCCSHCGSVLHASVMSECSRCRCAVYCSQECQKSDWLRHKTWCAEASLLPEGIDIAGSVMARQMPKTSMDDYVEGPIGLLDKKTAEVLNRKTGRRVGYWNGRAVVASREQLPNPSRQSFKRFSRYTLDREVPVHIDEKRVPKVAPVTPVQQDDDRNFEMEDNIMEMNHEAHERRKERRRGLTVLSLMKPIVDKTKPVKEEGGAPPFSRKSCRKENRIFVKLHNERQREVDKEATERAAFIRQVAPCFLKVPNNPLNENAAPEDKKRYRARGRQYSHVDRELSRVTPTPRHS
jgi:hypothetical protein